MAALEAMASSVPVVSTNAGGLPDLIEQGKSGFCCDIGDVDEMVKKSLHILDENNLEKFKKFAFTRAKDYNIKNILPLYVDYYKKILKSRNE